MSDIGEKIRASLWELQDKEYRDFHAKLIPTVAPEAIIGVRTPQVRRLAKELAKDPEIGEFLAQLPHPYYDENNIHAFVVEQIKDYGECLAQTERFLPHIDNWATCDMMAPRVFAAHKEELLEPIDRWIASPHIYTVRFGIGMLMRYYLDEDFRPEYPRRVAGVCLEENRERAGFSREDGKETAPGQAYDGSYYVNMMRAWYFATALTRQYEAVIPYLEEQRLDRWTHNKAIQKACESSRVTAEQKEYLRKLKV